jgi:toxin ParE1/3/4
VIRLVFTPLAEQDFEEIGLFIARDNPARAVSFVHDLRERCRKLRYVPLFAPAQPEFGAALRMARFGSYIILYEHDKEELTILRVIHGARYRG